MRDPLVDRIQQFYKRVASYLGSYNLVVDDHEYLAQRGMDEQLTERMLFDHAQQYEINKADVVKLGRALANELERVSFDTTNLLRLLGMVAGHCGGPKTVGLWRELDATLERFSIRRAIDKGTRDGQGGAGTMHKQRTGKRGKAKKLTGSQEAVVAAVEDFNLPVAKIAEQRGCTVQAVHALYGRAKENPGYKKRRSINLSDAKSLNANTSRKSHAPDDE